MKTLITLLSTFALIVAVSSLDSHRLDADVLFPAMAVAAVFAFALTEGRRPVRTYHSLASRGAKYLG
jgi:hypothetical protein